MLCMDGSDCFALVMASSSSLVVDCCSLSGFSVVVDFCSGLV